MKIHSNRIAGDWYAGDWYAGEGVMPWGPRCRLFWRELRGIGE